MSGKPKPWLTDPQFGGMSKVAAERSWRAAREERERQSHADTDLREHIPPAESEADFGFEESRAKANGGALSPAAEDSIALLFAERHAHELRYVAAQARWLSFDGSRWVLDDTLHAFDRARAICREIAIGGDKPISAIASAKTVAAVERLAKADRRLAATTVQWDASGWIFNTGVEDGDFDKCDL